MYCNGGGGQSWWRRTPAVFWKRKDRIMSLKREEIAIEDEPPEFDTVGTATLHRWTDCNRDCNGVESCGTGSFGE